MDRKAALLRLCSAASYRMRPWRSSLRSECKPAHHHLNQGEMLILVLLLSLGLWALIWAGVSLLGGAYG
jgi:hypothetical protein